MKPRCSIVRALVSNVETTVIERKVIRGREWFVVAGAVGVATFDEAQTLAFGSTGAFIALAPQPKQTPVIDEALVDRLLTAPVDISSNPWDKVPKELHPGNPFNCYDDFRVRNGWAT
jgi:hypothetical protein